MDIEITGEGKFKNVADKLSTKSYYFCDGGMSH